MFLVSRNNGLISDCAEVTERIGYEKNMAKINFFWIRKKSLILMVVTCSLKIKSFFD